MIEFHNVIASAVCIQRVAKRILSVIAFSETWLIRSILRRGYSNAI